MTVDRRDSRSGIRAGTVLPDGPSRSGVASAPKPDSPTGKLAALKLTALDQLAQSRRYGRAGDAGGGRELARSCSRALLSDLANSTQVLPSPGALAGRTLCGSCSSAPGRGSFRPIAVARLEGRERRFESPGLLQRGSRRTHAFANLPQYSVQ